VGELEAILPGKNSNDSTELYKKLLDAVDDKHDAAIKRLEGRMKDAEARKADDRVVTTELNSLRSDVEGIEKKVQEPYACQNEGTLFLFKKDIGECKTTVEELKGEMNKWWKSIKFGTIIGVIALVIPAGAYILNLGDGLKDTERSVAKIEKSVEGVVKSNVKVVAIVEKMQREETVKQKEDSLKKAFIDALETHEKNKKKKRKKSR
jgi:hypothetical protein